MGNGRSSPWGGELSMPGGPCAYGHEKSGPRKYLTQAALVALPCIPRFILTMDPPNPVIPRELARVTRPVCTVPGSLQAPLSMTLL